MRNLIIVLLMAISTVLVAQANAQECMKEAWVQEEAPTQGRGYHWIPAKWSDADPEKAKIIAMTDAIKDYVLKCGAVPVKTVVFNEICTEKPGIFNNGMYTVHVRLTYTQGACKLSRELEEGLDYKENMKYFNQQLLYIAKVARANGWR
jgi:hypothetical protein